MEKLTKRDIRLLLKALSSDFIDEHDRLSLESKLEKILDEMREDFAIKFRLPKERA